MKKLEDYRVTIRWGTDESQYEVGFPASSIFWIDIPHRSVTREGKMHWDTERYDNPRLLEIINHPGTSPDVDAQFIASASAIMIKGAMGGEVTLYNLDNAIRVSCTFPRD